MSGRSVGWENKPVDWIPIARGALRAFGLELSR
jgi:hypothetical protein